LIQGNGQTAIVSPLDLTIHHLSRVIFSRNKLLVFAGAIAIFFVLVAGGGTLLFLSPLTTRLIESDAFRASMEKETAKGLHFPSARYSAIRRTGAWTARCENFTAQDGVKALKSLDARAVTATFDPWGLFARQWRFSDIRVESGEVAVQVYEPQPETIAPRPWYAVLLPNRVYLNRIESPNVDVTWRFRGERAGFFGTQLLITPNGRDFEYRAAGGRLRMALVPELDLRAAHLLITKTLISIYQIDLASIGNGEGTLHGEGRAGVGKDRSVDFEARFEAMPLRPWLPKEWDEHLSGSISGNVHWKGVDPKLEHSSGEGTVRVRNGRLNDVPFLDKLAEFTREKSFRRLDLNDCSFNFSWLYPRVEIKDIAVAEAGKFRIEGELSIDRRRLGGTLRLGVARPYLDWLPRAGEIFNEARAGYLWTTVHLSGTIDQPRQDLSPRIIGLFKESPGALLQLLFRRFEDWLKRGFGGD